MSDPTEPYRDYSLQSVCDASGKVLRIVVTPYLSPGSFPSLKAARAAIDNHLLPPPEPLPEPRKPRPPGRAR